MSRGTTPTPTRGLLFARWVSLVACAACMPEPSRPETMRLEGLRPIERTAVALNEDLNLTFSERVDPTSVTTDNLFVVSSTGTRARGEWTADGQVVRFQPAPVMARDLSDGGFRPDEEYELHVLGFPRLDGLRSVSGTPLDACRRFRFHTVALDGAGIVLEDQSPGVCQRAWMPQRDILDVSGALQIVPLEPVLIRCLEPLDPSTLDEGEFWIVGRRPRHQQVVDPETGEERLVEDVEERRIDLRGRFRSNFPEGSRGPLDACAEIELMPVEALSPGWTYQLRTVPSPELADFRGNPAWAARERAIPIELGDPVRARRGRLFLSFLDRASFQHVDLPWLDGLAHWGTSGLLEVRFPAAAGDGAQGAVVLAGNDPRTDVRGTSVHVPAGSRATLPRGPGMRIVRAQGRLVVDGELVREGGAEPPFELDPFHPHETLSGWIERTRREARGWTVLVAGGDLTIRGSVRVETPLLLVAGGWIRVDGDLSHPPGQLWLLPEGGGAVDPTASRPDIVIDEPIENPLREELHYGAITSPLPSQVRDYRWLDLEVGGRAGAGEYRVRFLPSLGEIAPDRAVDHPGLLEGGGQLRILMELTVRPGAAWDPPSIDHVLLEWDPGS